MEKMMEQSNGYCPGWDIKFKKSNLFGNQAQFLIRQVIGYNRLEVKRCDKAKDSGNLFIEYADGPDGEKRKGISATESLYYAYSCHAGGIDPVMFWFRIPELKIWLMYLYYKKDIDVHITGGDTGHVHAFLLPILKLPKIIRPPTNEALSLYNKRLLQEPRYPHSTIRV